MGNNKTKHSELADLIFKRDQEKKKMDVGFYKYIHELSDLSNKISKAKFDNTKCRLTVHYYIDAINNHNGVVNSSRMDHEIKKQLEPLSRNLKTKFMLAEEFKQNEIPTEIQIRESDRIYKELIRFFNLEIISLASEKTADLFDFWETVEDLYMISGVDELSETKKRLFSEIYRKSYLNEVEKLTSENLYTDQNDWLKVLGAE